MAERLTGHAMTVPSKGIQTGSGEDGISSNHECGNHVPRWISAILLLGLALGGCGILSSSTESACVVEQRGAGRSPESARVVRTLRRQLNEKEHHVEKLESRLKAFEQSAEHSPPVQALRRQLEERDEHIVKLQSRLNTLKLIEEDRQKRKHFRQRRATITQPK